jgi:hypothetical protein
MPTDAALLTLLHLLAFAYWLGGDLGVFHASFLLTDEKRAAAGRLAAAKIVADVDLAPRFALLAALPTGLALAAAKGWLALPASLLAVAFLAAALWAVLVWRIHQTPGAASLRRVDLALRLAFMTGLAAAGAAGLAGALALPAFIAGKLLILALCVALGLFVRRALAPFGPAYAKLAGGTAGPEEDRAIRAALGRARPLVVAIWFALAAAAFLGAARPQ